MTLLEQVTLLIYLGSNIAEDAECKVEIHGRKKQG